MVNLEKDTRTERGQLPEMDGYETARTIRKREPGLGRPCLWKAPVQKYSRMGDVVAPYRRKRLFRVGCGLAGIPIVVHSKFRNP
jgi:hypothetical protein